MLYEGVFCGAGRMGCSLEALKPKDKDAQRFWARCGFGPLRGFVAFHHSPQRRAVLLAALAAAAAGRLTAAQCAEVGAHLGSEATAGGSLDVLVIRNCCEQGLRMAMQPSNYFSVDLPVNKNLITHTHARTHAHTHTHTHRCTCACTCTQTYA